MLPRSPLLVLALLGLLVALSPGCSRRTAPVEGVMLWDDGKPVIEASMRFVPVDGKGRESVAVTDKKGEFSLATHHSNDGTYPGEYKIVVIKFASTGGARPPTMNGTAEETAKAMKDWWDLQLTKQAKVTDPVPAVYSDEKTTPLRCTVESGGNKVELKLKRT